MAEMTSRPGRATKADKPQSTKDDADRLDQVRNLLFGQQVAGIDGQIAALERKVSADANAMSREFRLRLDTLETTLLEEIEGLQKKLEDRVSEVAHQNKESETDLRKQLREQGDDFTSAIQRNARESSEHIQSINAELTNTKLDRKEFSRVLIEAAERIAHDSDSESPQVS